MSARVCSDKAARQRVLRRKFGVAKPLPRTASAAFDVGQFATAKRIKITIDEPEMRARKRIKLAPGSKLALKFPHLVQGGVATKGDALGGETLGTASARSANPRLFHIV